MKSSHAADEGAPPAPPAGPMRSMSRVPVPTPVPRREHELPAEAPAALDLSGLTGLVGYAASRAALEMRKVFARSMQGLELKVVEFTVLTVVVDNPEVNQKAIGEALDISAPNLAVTLDRMVERGWVRRVRSERDRRAQHIRLTPSGTALVERARAIAATMEDAPLQVLSPGERALLLELLAKVSAGVPSAVSATRTRGPRPARRG